MSFIFRFLRVYSARVKINKCCGKINVDLTCSFCCDLQWGGVSGGAPQYKITKKIKVNKIKITLLVIMHSMCTH